MPTRAGDGREEEKGAFFGISEEKIEGFLFPKPCSSGGREKKRGEGEGSLYIRPFMIAERRE